MKKDYDRTKVNKLVYQLEDKKNIDFGSLVFLWPFVLISVDEGEEANRCALPAIKRQYERYFLRRFQIVVFSSRETLQKAIYFKWGCQRCFKELFRKPLSYLNVR